MRELSRICCTINVLEGQDKGLVLTQLLSVGFHSESQPSFLYGCLILKSFDCVSQGCENLQNLLDERSSLLSARIFGVCHI